MLISKTNLWYWSVFKFRLEAGGWRLGPKS